MVKKTKPLSWIIKNSKFIFPLVSLLTLISIAGAACSVFFALAARGVIDAATIPGYGKISEKIIQLVVLIVIQIGFSALYNVIHIRVLGKLDMRFKANIFNSVLKKDWQHISAFHSGELLNRITSDVTVITDAIVSIIPTVASLVVQLALSFTVLFVLDSMFAVIVIIFSPLIFIASRVYKKHMKALHKKVQASDGKTRSYMQETLQNILVVKSFRAEDYAMNQADSLQKNNFRYRIKKNTISVLANLSLTVVFSGCYYFTLGYGAIQIMNGIISYGDLTAMLQLVGRVQAPFKGIAGIVPQYYSAIASAERLMELEMLPDDETDSAFDVKACYDEMESVTYNKVSFAYKNSDSTLEDVELEIKKGEFLCIAGISGIGKSTLLRLALGFIHPTKGSITLNMKNGESIKAGSNVRKLFSYVPQGNMILSGTIRENIKFANTDATDDDVIWAAKTAQIWNDIASLPDGLDTMLGEKGLGLSEGQIQRISLARALLDDAPILLLDEATSALDEATEYNLLQALKAMKGKTCIIVSHKAAAISACDRTIYIKDKKITTEKTY